jgi:Tat protein secretion system quality control protein TatD with DNase activity
MLTADPLHADTLLLLTDAPVCHEHTSAKHFNTPLSLDFAIARAAELSLSTLWWT